LARKVYSKIVVSTAWSFVSNASLEIAFGVPFLFEGQMNVGLLVQGISSATTTRTLGG
jgi:hypothetical protein